jgi:hypothetical protein
MDHGSVDVIVDGVRCQVVQQDGERMLVQPCSVRGKGINVKRWVPVKATSPLPAERPKPFPLVLSDEEIKHLAAVLRQVFYEDESPDFRTATSH